MIFWGTTAHSAGPWIASHMYHRFSYCEFCDQRHVDAHRTLPSSLCGLALPGSWPSSDPDNTREIIKQVKQHKDMGFQAPVVQAWKQHATTWSNKNININFIKVFLLFFGASWVEHGSTKRARKATRAPEESSWNRHGSNKTL